MVFRKRHDGTYLEVPPLRRIVPYLMPTRTEATVYYQQRIEAEGLVDWLGSANAGRTDDERFTLFHVVLAAVARTIRLRPEANRFVVGRRTYEHQEISVAFMVKVAMTDDAPESQARIVFTGRESVEEVRAMVREAVHREHREEASGDDRLIDFFASWPRPVLRGVVRAVRSLDYHNALPGALADAIPLYTSVYVVNTGSIGVDAPLHHLYELGTASFFLAIGRLSPQPVVDEHGQVVARTCLDVTYTLDERASDGFYFARTVEVFRRLVADPRLLEDPDLTVEQILAAPIP